MKTTVFNVIILDKSGSMSSIARQAVDGVNETIGSIRSAQEKNPDQEHIVTLVAFCGCEMKTIYDNVPVAQVKTLTDRDYHPCCMTPLYDAVGMTITRVHALKSKNSESLALVTIITDGYENASIEYDLKMVKNLIDKLSEQQWTFTFIGTDDLDVEGMASAMGIRHTLSFARNEEQAEKMFKEECESRMLFYEQIENPTTCADMTYFKKKHV